MDGHPTVLFGEDHVFAGVLAGRLGGECKAATVLARLGEDLPDREFEIRHDVVALQNVGFGKGGDVGL